MGHWADFPERMKKAFPQDHIELLEIPGNGTLNGEKSPLTILDMVQSFRRQSTLIRENRKVHILAISMGAMMAAEWALRYPQEVERLVLINSSSATHSKFYERLQPKNYFKILALASSFKNKSSHAVEDLEREILAMTANSSERRAYALPLWTAESTAHPITLQNFVRQLWAANAYRFPPKAPVPSLILSCENDHFVSVSCSKALAKAWECPIYIHPWAGHDLPLDDPDWVLEKLRGLPS